MVSSRRFYKQQSNNRWYDRATNNSCGSRSLYYGNMVNNVLAVESILDDGSIHTFENIDKNYLSKTNDQNRKFQIIKKCIDIREQVENEINEHWPKNTKESWRLQY